jgi:nucleotide-binding universal stress UspA family protein
MIAEKLIENAREVGVDAIAVTNHATRGPKRWLSGSVCERLLYDCRFPLIVCRATEEPV